VGQGALGLEVRGDDAEAARLCLALVHPASAAACLAERTLMNRLQGGCQVPVGVYSWFSMAAGGGGEGVRLDACGDGRAYPSGACSADLTVRGSVLSLDGSAMITAEATRTLALPAAVADADAWRLLQAEAAALGAALARRIVAAGAEDILGPLTTAARPTSYGSAEAAGAGPRPPAC